MPDLDPIEPPANPEFEIIPQDDDSTTGTGSVLAIGCSLIVLILIIIGIALFISPRVH